MSCGYNCRSSLCFQWQTQFVSVWTWNLPIKWHEETGKSMNIHENPWKSMNIHENPHKILMDSHGFLFPIWFSRWFFPRFSKAQHHQGGHQSCQLRLCARGVVHGLRLQRKPTGDWMGFDGFFLGMTGMIFLGLDGIWWCFLGEFDGMTFAEILSNDFLLIGCCHFFTIWAVLRNAPHSLLKKKICFGLQVPRNQQRRRKE